MKIRLISAAALIPVLLAIVLVAPPAMFAVVCGLLSAIAAYELLVGTGLVKHIRLISYTVVMAFLVPLWCYAGMEPLWALLGIYLFVFLLFAELLISHARVRFERLVICIACGLIIPYMFSALVRIMGMNRGRQLMLIPIVLAFISDSGAYFVGRAWGRHKLSPTISPNKSIEGVAGGVVTAVLAMLLYCLILDLAFDAHVNYAYAVTYGIIGSFAGVFGDLCFSAIKRQSGIKDFGKLIPGHGGALDRFDSMILVAPLVELLLALLPVLE